MMEAAFRIGKHIWPHRFRIGTSAVCAALATILSVICLTAAIPVLSILVQGHNLHEHVTTQIAQTEADIARRDAYLQVIPKADLDRRARTQRRQKYATQRLHRLILTRDHLLTWIPRDNASALLCIACFSGVAGILCISALFGQELLVGRSVSQIGDCLRKAGFRYMLSCDSTTLATLGPGGHQKQIVDDVQTVSRMLQTALLRLVRGPLLAVTCLVIALIINWRLAFFSAIAARTVLSAANRLNQLLVRMARRNSITGLSVDAVRADVRATFSEMRSVIAFNAGDQQQTRFDRISQQHSLSETRTADIRALTGSISRLATLAAAVVIVLPGTIMYLHQTDTLWNIQLAGGTMNGVELLTLLVMQGTVVVAVAEIFRVWSRTCESVPALERVLAHADQPARPQQPDVTGFARSLASHIRFRNVTVKNLSQTQFSPPILNRINMTVRPGDVTAIVSDCGIERNTLVDLLTRFAEPSDGSVTFDGFDISDLRSEELRSLIGLITLEPLSKGGTAAAWIRFGRSELSEESIASAAEAAGVISEFPEGLQTQLGDQEIPWSAAARLRLGIARAIADQPRILIFDLGEILSEPGMTDILQQLLPAIAASRTVLITTPLIPPSILSSLSHVVVLEQGQITSAGTADEIFPPHPVTNSLHQNQNVSRAA